MENLKHAKKIVDGIPIKYLCQPCPECKAKLEAAGELAKVCQGIKDHADLNIAFTYGSPKPLYNDLVYALAVWEKAGDKRS